MLILLEQVPNPEHLLENEDYKGTHTAPNKEDAPLHDLTNTYPDDIYSDKGVLYYGDGSPFDGESIGIIRSAKGKPNSSVKIFRAVPDINKETNKKIKYYASLIYYANKFGYAPIYSKDKFASELNAKLGRDKDKFIQYLTNEIDQLEKEKEKKITINPGDWVTINRQYAVLHGAASLGGNYKILYKTVRAKELFTDGNSVHEWGYDPGN